LLVQAGKLEEAERLLTQAHERLLARFGPTHPEVAQSWHLLGRLAWEQGRLPQAQDALQQSLQMHRRGGDVLQRRMVLCDLAEVRLALGQPDSAELLARECQQLSLAQRPRLAARADTLLAEVARRRGSFDAAQALHASAGQRLLDAGFTPGDAAFDPIALARIALALDVGRLGDAVAELDVLEARPHSRTDATLWRWRISALRAEIDCRAGRLAEGRTKRDDVVREAATEAPQRQRLLDELAALAASCGR
jgi:serine/threonine-protein kinase